MLTIIAITVLIVIIIFVIIIRTCIYMYKKPMLKNLLKLQWEIKSKKEIVC